MLTYVGKGYTSGFVENYDRVADRLNAGEEDIELVDGPDDICEGLLCESHAHCFNEGVVKRDETARVSVSVLLGETLAAGQRLQATPDFLAKMRLAFAAGDIRQACRGCQWNRLCDRIAASGFAGVKIGEQPEPQAGLRPRPTPAHASRFSRQP
ncbi:DUF1284 domain-containing protein [Agrobacterium pusense]|jgi:hypothetical protein|uniref:DUF1284 domain-containing protein n=1 Tax=Agrobacterium pusense TaxID=648995 RepID=UPI000458E29B|nr:DUF1284 domain-containing protein [Agrobacterium pusense]AMD61669.1 hypothetical protein AWN88_23590 [Agrobacterium tumefaciens]TGR69930.1 DUF1284 domain-containing protein [bacterium M00.F.Ca.ET.194.01.1.1]TGS55471.1 DUF1284 domain-containing protein [bacterium M00.F.Ca.ET.179.01.1.1]TGV48346.1 DUF1284 domain-containing protein [bacterium M00.F.Ca.ET.168.01.1.1]KAJ34560.1 hypothetical protein BW45_03060 [Agrobacterium tumefaciens]